MNRHLDSSLWGIDDYYIISKDLFYAIAVYKNHIIYSNYYFRTITTIRRIYFEMLLQL